MSGREINLLACSLATTLLAGQVLDAQTPAASREAWIEAARDEKSKALEPDLPGKWERRLILVKDAKLLERTTAGIAGFRVKMGGLATGSGFALGPQYVREDLATGRLNFSAGVQGSMNQWWGAGAVLRTARWKGGRLEWTIGASHHDYNSIPYYGPGPESEKYNRSNYRLEDTNFDTMFTVRPARKVRIGVSTGYLMNNVGPGQDDRYISTDLAFSPRRTPGIDQQTDFWRAGVFGEIDYRDSPGGPRSGGHYSVRFDRYQDRVLKAHDFQRLDVELEQYVPLFNKRRVFALRARGQFTDHADGKTVPFYHQSVLGGSNDLRGYRPYRFYDENLVVFNAEYRWEIFSGLDGAIFADAGRVFHSVRRPGFGNLESSVGFGFRANVRNATFIRVDVGFSHEGFQVWVKFNDVFTQRPFGSSSAPIVY